MKLYWRYKKANGKYSWKPARTAMNDGFIVVVDWEEEE